MPKREVKAFLLRADPRVLAAAQRLADAELRSLNAQVEVLLREALRARGVKLADAPDPPAGPVDPTEVAK